MKRAAVIFWVILFASRVMGANSGIQVKAIRIHEQVSIDGVLSEPFWRDDLGIADFKQRDPQEGAAPTQKTVVDVAYDDSAIYIAARMYDSHPEQIVSRLVRKDVSVDSDKFTFYVDPYYDRRTGFYFAVNAAGTMYDGTLMNDGWDDNSWDGVWEGKAHVDEKGWTAEMRIPYSQLRFQKKDQQVWGINFSRVISRNNESDYVVYTPKNEQGFVSRFADLTGIENLSPPKRIEVIPYVTSKADFTHAEDGDPFNDGSAFTPGFGADARLGIGSNLTLNATLNPDFGQVEVDPAVVNLGDVETFFPEKRPFFIEGSSIFSFGEGGATDFRGFNWGGPSFFYSRRIGRVPQGSTPDSADYEDVPAGTQILTATKLTGKLAGSWNVGSLLAVTDREFASVSEANTLSSKEVEPLTYYSVSRVLKEFDEGREGLGFITTYTDRQFDDPTLSAEINDRAMAFAADGWTFLDSNKKYVVTGWFGTSHVTGSTERITDLQQESRHYFQRPDADHVEVDPNATSLNGYAGRVSLNKEKGNVMLNAAFGAISPGFDVNDVGFEWRTDMLNGHVVTGYKWTQPGKWYRSARLNAATFHSFDFGGNNTWSGYSQFGNVEFLNYYFVDWFLTYNPQTVSNNLTRGGPTALNPRGYEIDGGISSDSRKRIVLGFRMNHSNYASDSGTYTRIYPSFEWKPSSKFSLQVSPTWETYYTNAQYVDTIDDPFATATYEHRYVFGELDQKTLSASVRVNYTFTPTLSLQFYTQPLVSSGDYYNYGELARPRSYEFSRYGSNYDAAAGTVDPDGAGPAAPFELDDPSFNYKSLRGNAVLRWEFRPGSVMYFVWTQSREDTEEQGNFQLSNSFHRLWNAPADNIVLIKFSYYWNPS